MFKNDISDEVKHSAAHVLAHAVLTLYPEAKIGIGPVTREGFYYDFDLKVDLTPEKIAELESTINQLIQGDIPFQQIVVDREQAINLMLQKGQIYKAELIHNIPDYEISFFKTGDNFIDLCRGPHVSSTKEIGPIKIIKTEKTHWNEDPSRPELIRIYGMVFKNINEMSEYFAQEEEIKKREYKSLSYKLGYSFSKTEFSPTEKGSFVIKKINELILEKFQENEYRLLETKGETSQISEISNLFNKNYKTKNRSYKEFPIGYYAYSTIATNSLGAVHIQTVNKKALIFRKYSSTYGNDLTILIEKCLALYETLLIEINCEITSNDAKNPIVAQISNILQKHKVSHTKIISEKEEDINVIFFAKDDFDREFRLSLINIIIDEGTFYYSLNNQKTNPYILQNIFSIYTIYQYLLEKNSGDLPNIITPVQVVCIPLGKDTLEYCDEVRKYLANNLYSVEADTSCNSMKFKIQRAEKHLIPIILVIGNKEKQSRSVSIRYDHANQGLASLENITNVINDQLKK